MTTIMAGSHPEGSPQYGVHAGGLSHLHGDKHGDGGRWYFSRKEIEENSPSRRDGIDLKKEVYLRKSYCTFLQDLGMKLKVPQVTIATAITFCHRFYLCQSHAENDGRTIATACMFLAGKVEETPRPLKDVILVYYEIIHKKDPSASHKIKQKEVYEQHKELILLAERVVLATLGFDLNVQHPYKPLVDAIKKFKVAQHSLAQVAWNFVNDGLRTSLCLQFKPHHIAAGAIFLAAKFLSVKLPSDGDKVWWEEFDVTPCQLEEISNQMLELYEQNKLPPSQGSEAECAPGRPAKHASSRASTEDQLANSNKFLGGGSIRPGYLKAPSSKFVADHEDDSHGAPSTSTLTQSDDYGMKVMNVLEEKELVEPKVLGPMSKQDDGNVRISNSANIVVGSDGNRIEGMELKDKCHNHNMKHKKPAKIHLPHEVLKAFDEERLNALREKRKKSCCDATRRMDAMEEYDLIVQEFEDGVELAAASEEIILVKKQSQPQS